MSNNFSDKNYVPIFELSRGETVESIHFGAVAVVDAQGRLLAWYGNPSVVTFLRSTAKPFQALPFLEQGGQAYYGLTAKEIALVCASHSGTDAHVDVALAIQAKAGFNEADLLCGVHPPLDASTAEALRERKEPPSPNRHNCSGKHSGMMAFVRMSAAQGEILDDRPYIDLQHPIQKRIRRIFSEMCGMDETQVVLGIDGCSAPNFAVPLWNAAWGYARLCDPETGGVQPAERAQACHSITDAMMRHPDMVAGPGRFDSQLMEIANGRIVCKGGAEGYQGIGIMPGALDSGSPALGIAIKISDGDARGRVSSAVTIEVLRQLNVLSPADLAALVDRGPNFPILNWRKILVGQGYPIFKLSYAD